MKKIKRIEIRDKHQGPNKSLIEFSELLNLIENSDSYSWGILFFDALYYSDETQPIANYINQNIRDKKIIPITWDEINILAKGIGQFIDLILIGCKDSKNLKLYQDDEEMIKNCDVVIINFDGCWWEVSCKDKELMQKYLNTFKEVKVISF